jgi:ubiquinone/menaquinone biosynthesis C-methylase UbiE
LAGYLSTTLILHGAARMADTFNPKRGGDYLDIGAGDGDLIAIVQKRFAMTPYACDSDPGLMEGDFAVDAVDLDSQKLPYLDSSFDLVTCTEVMEHLENFRFAVREAFRVLRPGGIFVLTTPNVLNLTSRIRYLMFGFANSFGPLKFHDRERHTTAGHISPIGHFYLVHGLTEAGFAEIRTAIDKWQRRSLVWLAMLWLPISIGATLAYVLEMRHYRTIDALNRRFVRQLNSLDILLGRTLIVGCRKPL